MSAAGDQMTSRAAGRARADWGDFPTPPDLAAAVCAFLRRRGLRPASILDPTCGSGNFLVAARDTFPGARLVGVELDPGHAARARRRVGAECEIIREDVFRTDWRRLVGRLPAPLLLLGNPPWVTSAQLSRLGSANRPVRSNHSRLRGIDAITGKSNFDLAEWIILAALGGGSQPCPTAAFLCKTAVARRVLGHIWSGAAASPEQVRAAMVQIDAARLFRAAADACLFVASAAPEVAWSEAMECPVYDRFAAPAPSSTIAYRDGQLIADSRIFAATRFCEASSDRSGLRWRSGVKHDCAAVMELEAIGGEFRNKLGAQVAIERDYVYPLLKSSDLDRNRLVAQRALIVPQRAVGEPTEEIARRAPRTWAYLEAHGKRLDRRASSVYSGRPRFSIFGVGPYTFAPWKVATSGLYKRLAFRCVGPHEDKPVVFDDTCYFVACADATEARRLLALLSSPVAQEFFAARIFWDCKRPVTAALLGRLDLDRLARALNDPGEGRDPAGGR